MCTKTVAELLGVWKHDRLWRLFWFILPIACCVCKSVMLSFHVNVDSGRASVDATSIIIDARELGITYDMIIGRYSIILHSLLI